MNRKTTHQTASRAGSVLLVVLVIIVLLSLAAYTFTQTSLAENEATVMFGRSVQARAFAESGIDLAANLLVDPAERAEQDPTYNRPDLFAAVLMRSADVPRGRGRFSVVAPVETDPSGRTLRYGLMDESAKLNVNALVSWNLSNYNSRMALMWLPNMTYDIADSILDWIDTDSTVRQYGAENDYYLSLPKPYQAANGPISSLDDLLMVKGVTPELLYGEDLNRNGVLDPGEDVNGDGYLDRGWSAYLTVNSSERNITADGNARINMNSADLPTLYNSINGQLGQSAAQFIVGYRMNGPGGSGSGRGNSNTNSGTSSLSSASSLSSMSSSGSSSSGSSGSGSGGSGGGSSGSGGSSGQSGSSSSSNLGTTVNLNGMTVSQTGNHAIDSVYRLIGATTTATINGRKKTLQSPWANTQSQIAQYLPQLLDSLTTTDNVFIPGRVNVNLASLQVLEGLPGMTQALANTIVAAQSSGNTSAGSQSGISPRSNTSWLVIEGLTNVSTMVSLAPYLTAHGDVYRVQSVGYFDEGGPVVRLEATIDATMTPARIINLRDLSELGRGFTPKQLGVP
jgi:DNA uptake protein ComE-like DNA-binding protein